MMALDSAGRGPLLLGYPEHLWPRQAEILCPVYPPVVRYHSNAAATMDPWPRIHPDPPPSPDPSGSIHWKRRSGGDPSRQRSTPIGVREREVPLLPWQPTTYQQREQKMDDVIATAKAAGALSRQPFHRWSDKEQSDDVIVTTEMRPRTSSWQRHAYDSKNNPPSADVGMTSWQRFAYDNRNNQVDVSMTSSSVTSASGQSPWQPSALHQVKDQSAACSDAIMTSYRERSQSTGSWRSFDASRAHSGSSLASWNGTEAPSPISGAGQRSEPLSEATYRELVNLWASSRARQRTWDSDRAPGPAEVPRSPFEEEVARRRFSEASQRQYLKVRMQQVRQRYDDLPIDMTCRKRKTKAMSPTRPEHTTTTATATASSTPATLSTLSSSEPSTFRCSEMSTRSSDSALSSEMSSASSMLMRTPESSSELSRMMSPQHPSSDERSEGDGEEETGGDHQPSILRSMLTERGRCYSMSALELRRRRRRLQASRALSPWPADDLDGRGGTARTRLATISAPTSTSFGASDKQLVTLAKKNLLPVTARVTDLLGRIADFARSLPEFLRLSSTDQEGVLTSACLRLLVLYMAETNLQFATTTVLSTDNNSNSCSGSSSTSESPAGTGEGLPAAPAATAAAAALRTADQKPREPTVQFVGCLQNFVRKCQTLNVTGEEYFQMKLITLFHSGVGSPDCVRSSVRINSVARQDLQECVLRNHPNERLRYSTLLLSLHTLFGIHCDMLRSLFCQHLNRTGGVQGFIADALAAEAGEKKEVKG